MPGRDDLILCFLGEPKYIFFKQRLDVQIDVINVLVSIKCLKVVQLFNTFIRCKFW